MATINEALMYDEGGACRMCRAEDDGSGWRDHAADCPARVVEGLKYEVTYYGPNCSRSCCGSVEGAASGTTLEACVEDAAESLLETIRHRCEARLVFEIDDVDINALVSAARVRLVAARKAKKDAEAARVAASQAAKDRAKALADLEAQRGDLTPEAYERRREAIERGGGEVA